ncbi:MAG TPA: polysaccharide lyase family 8 super-sandwich domain-containing protein [Opitutaceae bacterium]|nr:polysaccharide lyase family 8 super-sandwich domain-containing protein [Opitutaceae bacterium]
MLNSKLPLLGTFLVFCFATLLNAAGLPAQVSPAVEKAADQFRDFNLGRDGFEPAADPKRALTAARSLQTDGSWADLDYASTARSGWPPDTHCTRMVSMAAAVAGSADISAGDRQLLLAAVHRAFRFWISHDFQCTNWWYNQIGIPKLISTCALLLGQNLSPDEYAYVTQILAGRCKIGMTGQNKVWLAGNTLMIGLLKGDEPLIDEATTTIWNEVRITTDEGIQPDYSFHQHGPQQQFGNYGLAFADETCRWGTILRGTPWALPEDKLEIFRHYLLDGENWVSWRGTMDISSCGRQLTPHSPLEKTASIARVMQEAAVFDPGSAPTYRAFVARNHPGAANDLAGNKYFWRSDYMVQRTGEFAATLKMSSNRVVGTELVNRENLSGYHLADGALYLYQRGDEYADIFPAWDWRKIPGTTCAQTDPPELKNSSVKTDFVGGVSDGTHGCAALDYTRDGVVAKKAWFFGANSVVCLGAGISGDSEAPIVTAINQCLLRGGIRLQQNGKVKSVAVGGDTPIPNVEWVEHDGWRYFFPGGCTVHLEARPATGNWKRVFQNPDTPKKDVTCNRFTLWLDHGNAPKNASYAYAIVPAGEKTAAVVTTNSSAVQAVQIDQAIFGVVFWLPGKVALTDGLSVGVDQPCLVLIDTEKHIAWISEPTQKLRQIRLQVGGFEQTIPLPAGGAAGKTVELPMTMN